MKVKPLNDRVLIKRIETNEEVQGGIIIPDTAKEKPQQAKVVAVGPGRLGDEGRRIPMAVRVGNRVLVGRYGGTEIKLEGEDHTILREDEILAVIGTKKQK